MTTHGMTARERFLIGGAGGLAPILIFVVQGDLQPLLAHNYLLVQAIAFGVKVIGLFLVGGLVAWLHPTQNARSAVFLLGMGAPAMIAGYQGAAANAASNAANAPVAPAASGMIFLPVVHAQAVANPSDLKHFTLPVPSAGEQIYQGLTGAKPTNVWFVITGSYASLDNARAEAARINSTYKGFHADVYAPFVEPVYRVVIGAQMTQQDANALRDRALSAGMDKQTYARSFPNLPYP